MSSSPFYDPETGLQTGKWAHLPPFKRIYTVREALNLPATGRALERLACLPVTEVSSKEEIPAEHRTGETLFITVPLGETVGHCPGSRGHLCCNYLTVDLYLGCSLGCSYCIMKSYLNFEPITVYADTAPVIRKIREIAEKNPDRRVRVGSGETGDSLLLDPIFELSREIISGLADLKNVFFESKTKTASVDHLLDIPEKGNAVVAFSLNAEKIYREEEGCAATLEARIEAAHKAVGAGYLTAFHFDPVIRFDGWEEAYSATIELLKSFAPEKVAWISLGTFRYPPALKDRMEDRPYLYGEFLPSRDGKYRYLQKTRSAMYRSLREKIKAAVDAPVYLCMESADMWRAVYGSTPMKINDVRDIFRGSRGIDNRRSGST
jgi:spore photoproduct lyase